METAMPERKNGAGVVRVPGWEQMAWLRHGFSTREGGVSTVYQAESQGAHPESRGARPEAGGELNLGWTAEDAPEQVAENRRRFVRAVWPEGEPTLVTVRQVHSAVSLLVGETAGTMVSGTMISEAGRALCEGDGLITAAPGVLLGIQTADCVPVLVVDTARRVVAAFHAGWRGTAAGIVERGVVQMQREFGSQTEDLIAAVGPSIGACCYIVGEEVRRAFEARFDYAAALFRAEPEEGQYRLDLWEANRRQLAAAGLAEEKIAVLAECTGCSGRYFSHRVERGVTGRMISAVGVAAQP
jgi:polyphenol oxidase